VVEADLPADMTLVAGAVLALSLAGTPIPVPGQGADGQGGTR
jgi:hypothetical protein